MLKNMYSKIVSFMGLREQIWQTHHRWQYNRNMCFSCWINKATYTHSESVLIITWMQWQHKHCKGLGNFQCRSTFPLITHTKVNIHIRHTYVQQEQLFPPANCT